MPIEYSPNAAGRGLKILLWGATASRKTETGLRYFPHVMLIDTEGNSDQCVGMPEVPPFMRIKTKDVYEVAEVMDAVALGEVIFPDGTPVETLMLDGISVLWSVRQEVGAMQAERRAEKYARGQAVDPDKVTMTQLDWVLAKRPLKRINARLNNPGVKYVILTAREKDQYEETIREGKKELIKTGVTIDAMRGVDYEVNIAFHMFNTTPWKCQITKVQGALGNLFQMEQSLGTFPYAELLAYATSPAAAGIDEITTAAINLKREQGRTQKDLIDAGRALGLAPSDVAAALKASGIGKFDIEKWDEMTEALKKYVAGKGASPG